MKTQEVADVYAKRITEIVRKLQTTRPWTSEMVESAFMGGLNILESLYGNNSSQVREFSEYKKTAQTLTARDGPDHYYSLLGASDKGTLSNAREELEAGLIRNLTKEAAGEVIGDLVVLAKEELKEGFIPVAAVLASAALEDALKRKAEELELDVEGKSLEDVINALKSNSFFRGAQTKIITSFVRLRNYAMHAEWKKIQETDVSSLIGFLEPFLLEHFS